MNSKKWLKKLLKIVCIVCKMKGKKFLENDDSIVTKIEERYVNFMVLQITALGYYVAWVTKQIQRQKLVKCTLVAPVSQCVGT